MPRQACIPSQHKARSTDYPANELESKCACSTGHVNFQKQGPSVSLIWTAKNYSEDENRNSMDTVETMNNMAPDKISYLIVNKYG